MDDELSIETYTAKHSDFPLELQGACSSPIIAQVLVSAAQLVNAEPLVSATGDPALSC